MCRSNQLALDSAHEAFDENGTLKSDHYQDMLEGIKK